MFAIEIGEGDTYFILLIKEFDSSQYVLFSFLFSFLSFFLFFTLSYQNNLITLLQFAAGTIVFLTLHVPSELGHGHFLTVGGASTALICTEYLRNLLFLVGRFAFKVYCAESIL